MFGDRVTGAGVLLAQRCEAELGFFGVWANCRFFVIVVKVVFGAGRCANWDLFVAYV